MVTRKPAARQTFASVDIFDNTDKGSFSWIKPQGALGYAVADNDKDADIQNSVFAVLCADHADAQPGTHSVDPPQSQLALILLYSLSPSLSR